jgi:hypothetical protein
LLRLAFLQRHRAFHGAIDLGRRQVEQHADHVAQGLHERRVGLALVGLLQQLVISPMKRAPAGPP